MGKQAPKLTDKNSCPHCGGEYLKGIYLGLPLRICADERCGCAQGPALWAMEHIPITDERGWGIFIYQGSYLRGLFEYFTK